MRHKSAENAIKKKTARQPISLTPDEDENLGQYAQTEKRSKSAMATIIYRIGEETYAARLRTSGRGK